MIQKRIFIKAVIYRITASLMTATLAYLFTGSVDSARKMAVGTFFAKVIWYYIFDRSWSFFNIKKFEIILKTISYRITASCLTALITWMITGSMFATSGVALGDLILKIFWYSFYEKLWKKWENK